MASAGEGWAICVLSAAGFEVQGARSRDRGVKEAEDKKAEGRALGG